MTTSPVVARPHTGAQIVPARIAAELALREQLWRPHVRFRHPRHYTRLLARPGWEAWLLTWLPGQSTGLHDHGGSAGAFAVLEGVLEETVLTGGADALVRRSRPYTSGQVRRFGSHHVHDVAPADAPAVSLHVYAPALTGMTRYALDGGRLSPLATERAGADW
jgi:predicted metal-dependent enzyme (double-stranded beta helix superfamily)